MPSHSKSTNSLFLKANFHGSCLDDSTTPPPKCNLAWIGWAIPMSSCLQISWGFFFAILYNQIIHSPTIFGIECKRAMPLIYQHNLDEIHRSETTNSCSNSFAMVLFTKLPDPERLHNEASHAPCFTAHCQLLCPT